MLVGLSIRLSEAQHYSPIPGDPTTVRLPTALCLTTHTDRATVRLGLLLYTAIPHQVTMWPLVITHYIQTMEEKVIRRSDSDRSCLIKAATSTPQLAILHFIQVLQMQIRL